MPSDPVTGNLLGMLAHDFRTPLSSILLHLELLESAPGLTEEEREDVEYALSSARALDDLISMAVDATGDTDTSRGDHDLAAVVRQARDLESAAGSGRSVELAAPDTLQAHFDPALTLRVVRAMIASARAVTPASRPIRVRLRSRGSRARVEVVDEGETILEGLREMLFDAAGAVDVRAHHRALSRGIGPVFCKRVAEAHGGDAGVEPAEKTSEGRGNVFWLELPLGSAPNAP